MFDHSLVGFTSIGASRPAARPKELARRADGLSKSALSLTFLASAGPVLILSEAALRIAGGGSAGAAVPLLAAVFATAVGTQAAIRRFERLGPYDPVLRALAMRRRRLPLCLRFAALIALCQGALPAAVSAAIDADVAVSVWAGALSGLLALVLSSAMLAPLGRTDAALRAARAQRERAAASAASAVMPAQSPDAIFSFGATQLPPTQSTFDSRR